MSSFVLPLVLVANLALMSFAACPGVTPTEGDVPMLFNYTPITYNGKKYCYRVRDQIHQVKANGQREDKKGMTLFCSRRRLPSVAGRRR